MNIHIIGVGMGDDKSLTVYAKEIIENADILIGVKRITEPFADGKKVFFEYTAEKVFNILNNNECENAAILFSGDASFFSGAKKILELYPDAEVIPGISSVSYFCSKIGLSYDDMNIISMHGRKCNIVSEVRRNKKTAVLVSKNICKTLCDYGFGNVEVYIGENLSYENERISHSIAEDFKDREISTLSVIVIVNNEYDNRIRIGIKDDEFIRGESPMTKSEIRAVSISKLEIAPDNICWDIGAGTGSVSIEMAMLCSKGTVYAIEKNAAATKLIAENAMKFKTDNINVVQGEAPEVLDELPKPDKVFIGGSSGKMRRIIEAALAKNEDIKFVINAIAIETLSETVHIFEDMDMEFEISQISTARSKKAGKLNLMSALNPVFVISGSKKSSN